MFENSYISYKRARGNDDPILSIFDKSAPYHYKRCSPSLIKIPHRLSDIWNIVNQKFKLLILGIWELRKYLSHKRKLFSEKYSLYILILYFTDLPMYSLKKCYMRSSLDCISISLIFKLLHQNNYMIPSGMLFHLKLGDITLAVQHLHKFLCNP